MTVTNVDADEFRYVEATDPLARPLLDELEYEYDTRYGDFFGERASTELNRYPAELFAPSQGGAFVLLLRAGEPIAGGAFKRLDEHTAELKRIWTSSRHRRQGLARRIVNELESEAIRQGYTKVYLTTGPRQPEAKALYLAAGYRPLYDTALEPEQVGIHPFEKTLGVER